MELAPLPSVFICLPIVLLCLWLRLVFLRLSILSLSFVSGLGIHFPCFFYEGFSDPNCHVFCLNFYSILTTYQLVTPKDEMSKNSIFIWMYLCIPSWYLSTISHSYSLIPILVRKVWKTLVNSGTVWSFPVAVWLILYISHHNFQQGSIVP
jgi:hypothetical protein